MKEFFIDLNSTESRNTSHENLRKKLNVHLKFDRRSL